MGKKIVKILLYQKVSSLDILVPKIHELTQFLQVKSHISKAAQPGLTSVCVDWEQHGADVPGPVQAPRQITALFSGSRQVVYGYVPNCLMVS